jgi:hypothetical protein
MNSSAKFLILLIALAQVTWANDFNAKNWQEAIRKIYPDSTLVMVSLRPNNPPYPKYSEFIGLAIDCKERRSDQVCLKAQFHLFEQEIYTQGQLGPIIYAFSAPLTIEREKFSALIGLCHRRGKVREIIREYQKLNTSMNFTSALARHFDGWDQLSKFMLVAPFGIIIDFITVPFQPFAYLAENTRLKAKAEDVGQLLEKYLLENKMAAPEYFKNYRFFYSFQDLLYFYQ